MHLKLIHLKKSFKLTTKCSFKKASSCHVNPCINLPHEFINLPEFHPFTAGQLNWKKKNNKKTGRPYQTFGSTGWKGQKNTLLVPPGRIARMKNTMLWCLCVSWAARLFAWPELCSRFSLGGERRGPATLSHLRGPRWAVGLFVMEKSICQRDPIKWPLYVLEGAGACAACGLKNTRRNLPLSQWAKTPFKLQLWTRVLAEHHHGHPGGTPGQRLNLCLMTHGLVFRLGHKFHSSASHQRLETVWKIVSGFPSIWTGSERQNKRSTDDHHHLAGLHGSAQPQFLSSESVVWFGVGPNSTYSSAPKYRRHVPKPGSNYRVHSHRVQRWKKYPQVWWKLDSLWVIGPYFAMCWDVFLKKNYMTCFDQQEPVAQVELNFEVAPARHQHQQQPSTALAPHEWKMETGRWEPLVPDQRVTWSVAATFSEKYPSKALEKHLKRKVYGGGFESRLIPRVLFFCFPCFTFFFFFLSPQLMPVGNSSRPSAGMSPPRHALQCAKGLTQPLPKAVRTKSTTSFSTEKHPRWFLSAFNGHFLLSSRSWHRLIPRH